MIQLIIELPEMESIKDKRRIVKSLKEKLIRRYKITVAEVDLQDSLAFAQLGAAVVSNSKIHGEKIMQKALEVPMRKIASNAGEDGAVIIENVRRLQKSRKNHRVGYNVMNGDYVDMVEAGIPDPAKVTRGAVENAASIASMILTTEALITDIPEEESAPAMPDGGGMGMY